MLKNVIEFENKIIRKEDHLNRVTTSMFDKMTAEQRDEARRKEMSAGIKELEDADDSDVENGKPCFVILWHSTRKPTQSPKINWSSVKIVTVIVPLPLLILPYSWLHY